jgi:large subunit ribosomal protein L17
MMHGKQGRKLGVKTPHRKAMFANMCSSLILNKRIETTLPRAKELRRVADRMVTLGKRQTIHARRQAFKVLRDTKAVKAVFDDIAPQFADRNGGYTRIMKLGYRRGDSAPMAIIEYLVTGTTVAETPKPKPAAKKEKKAKVKAEARREKKPESKTKVKRKTTPKKEAKTKKATKKVEKRAAKKSTTRKKTSTKK